MDTLSMGCKKMILETNPHNPRTISKDSYEKLKASIERNPDGLTANKIAYKDGIIISGNQRYRAILELGLTIKPEWLKDLSGWTQEQIDEWVIQSNISAGEWDWDILANEWEQTDLEEWGIDKPQEWTDEPKGIQGEDFNTDNQIHAIKISAKNIEILQAMLPEIKAITSEYDCNVSVNSTS